jgi:ubiquinone/menaquinone biosynthesis C-methylase UbiE
MHAFSRMRARVVPGARGVIAEVGFGSGLNLPFYDKAKVARLIGIDPDATMLDIARKRSKGCELPLELLEATAERLPLRDASVDTVVVSYALCTIAEPNAALRQIRRVLKTDGRLLFLEHGRSDRLVHWQDRLNKLWGRIAGGCHLNRSPRHLLEAAGFTVRMRYEESFPWYLWQLGSHVGGEAF